MSETTGSRTDQTPATASTKASPATRDRLANDSRGSFRFTQGCYRGESERFFRTHHPITQRN